MSQIPFDLFFAYSIWYYFVCHQRGMAMANHQRPQGRVGEETFSSLLGEEKGGLVSRKIALFIRYFFPLITAVYLFGGLVFLAWLGQRIGWMSAIILYASGYVGRFILFLIFDKNWGLSDYAWLIALSGLFVSPLVMYWMLAILMQV